MCNAWQEAASHAEGLDTECVKVFVYHPLKVIEIFDIEGRQPTDHPDGTPAVQWFNPCGSPLEIRHYRNGLRHGLSTKYDRSGLRRRVSHWVDGKLCDSPEGRPAVVELWVGGTTKLITYKTDGQPSTPGANTRRCSGSILTADCLVGVATGTVTGRSCGEMRRPVTLRSGFGPLPEPRQSGWAAPMSRLTMTP